MWLVRPSPARRRAGPGPRLLAVAAAVLALGLSTGGRPPPVAPTGDVGAADGSPGLAVAGEGSPRSRRADRQPFRAGFVPPPSRPPVASSARPPPEETAVAAGDPARASAAATGNPDDPARGDGAFPGPDVVAQAPEGFGVVAGAASAGSGERRTFTVEVEEGFEADADELLDTTVSALLDTESSWARDHTLAQVEDPGAADVRVVLASPATVDERCGAAGLDTEGDSSCWDGERTMLNGDRWRNGVDHVDDLETYRAYLVNHEVGHALGHGHVDCPEAGAAAPVMMQQTLGLDGCRPNPWPYP